MATNVMAVFQDVDKCMKCNGCVIACKREWNMRAEAPGAHTVSYDQRVAIKSQKRVDMGPFVRFSCWHCPDPPCAGRCPFKAIVKKPNGAVSVDESLCNPTACKAADRFNQAPCVTDCQRGGYPKIGKPHVDSEAVLMNKCSLCAGRAGSDDDVRGSGLSPLQTRATAAEIAAVPEKAHEPACVSTCPAKSMKWDTRANILTYLQDPANGYIIDGTNNWVGNGSMFWASKKTLLVPPKADPFIEDHVAPMVNGLLTSPVAKAVLLPTLVIGGLMALSARRSNNEADALTGGEV